jgi:hypothetical protein
MVPVVRLETVAITPDQYRQAVDLLASMILKYHHAQRCRAELPGDQAPTAG